MKEDKVETARIEAEKEETRMREKYARAFREWELQYRNNPKQFITELEKACLGVDDYGDRCAAYFLKLLEELSDAR